jgi:hypothetical protein
MYLCNVDDHGAVEPGQGIRVMEYPKHQQGGSNTKREVDRESPVEEHRTKDCNKTDQARVQLELPHDVWRTLWVMTPKANELSVLCGPTLAKPANSP